MTVLSLGAYIYYFSSACADCDYPRTILQANTRDYACLEDNVCLCKEGFYGDECIEERGAYFTLKFTLNKIST